MALRRPCMSSFISIQPCSRRVPHICARTSLDPAGRGHARQLVSSSSRPFSRPLPSSPHHHACPARHSVQCSSGMVKGVLSSYVSDLGTLEPQLAFLADGLDEVLLPVVAGWLLIKVISKLARRARKWREANPDEPLSLEVLGLLPAALENPSRLAITFLVTTRVLRNLAGMLQAFVETFNPQWNSFADVLVSWIIKALGPLDQTLLTLYFVVAVFVTTRVLIKWKTIALEFVLKHQRAKEMQHQVAMDDSSRYHNSSSSSGSSSGSSSAASSAGEDDDRQSAGDMSGGGGAMVTLEGKGGVLQLSMRRRATAAALQDAESAAAAAAAAGAGPFAAAAAAAEGLPGSSGAGGSRSSSRKRSNLVGKSADDMERLLLPLDGILNWVLVVMAALFTAQTLGLNVQPLLAIGGASSIIIGLATQTLLTNAVMGVSIFLSRPFVAGDVVTVQGIGNIIISGTVERVTPMRTMMRTDDDVLVMVPNKTVADMVVYNKSRREARSRLTSRSRSRQYLKFKVKLPHKELQQLEGLQDSLRQALRRPGVAQQSVELGLSKFTDAGAEVLVKYLLLVAPSSAIGQKLLLDLSLTVRQHGATLVSIL